MDQADILRALEEREAVLRGHFVLTSGRHSDTYIQCARILEDPALTTRLAETMASRLEGSVVDLVAAPAVGAIVIGFALAQALGVKFIFSERERGEMRFRRSFSVPEGSRVVVVEDVVTTGGSMAEVISLVREAGGEVAAALSIIDRGGPKSFDVDLRPLVRLEVESWDAPDCPLCAAAIPLSSPGSRRLS